VRAALAWRMWLVRAVLVMGDDVDSTLTSLQAELPLGDATLIRGTPPFFVEILHPDVHKGAGLCRLCEALRVPLGAVVAFGDGDNDVEFVQAAGLGYAMANARPTLKAGACGAVSSAHPS
jgi:hydroxymethylpyrimidine pyrophosphatase-like HAD family hydrolase